MASVGPRAHSTREIIIADRHTVFEHLAVCHRAASTHHELLDFWLKFLVFALLRLIFLLLKPRIRSQISSTYGSRIVDNS